MKTTKTDMKKQTKSKKTQAKDALKRLVVKTSLRAGVDVPCILRG
jgi:hypothetical protein